MSEFEGEAKKIAPQDYEAAAAKLMCDVAAVKAVVEVESGGRTGFLADKRPKILFESRWFHKLTGGRHDETHPGISTPKWVRNYKGGAGEYERLAEAIELDRTAALKSASWGMFQILGVNHGLAGFDTVEEFVERQCVSEGEHVNRADVRHVAQVLRLLPNQARRASCCSRVVVVRHATDYKVR